MGADRCHTEMPGEYLHSSFAGSIIFRQSLWALVTASRLMGLLRKPSRKQGTLRRGWWQTQGAEQAASKLDLEVPVAGKALGKQHRRLRKKCQRWGVQLQIR